LKIENLLEQQFLCSRTETRLCIDIVSSDPSISIGNRYKLAST